MNEDAYIEEQNPTDADEHALAIQNEQLMRNMSSDQIRSNL